MAPHYAIRPLRSTRISKIRGAVHRVQHSAVDQLEKQDAGLGVHGLVCDGSLLLVLDAVLTLALFDGEVSDLVIHFVGELKGRND